MRGFTAGLFGVFTFCVLAVAGLGLLIWHPDTPLPAPWNPSRPLDPVAQVTPLVQ